jgi:hypothetical protein
MTTSINASDISTFFQTSSKAKNDETNNIRERVLGCLSAPPQEFLADPEFGDSWRIVQKEWTDILTEIAKNENIPEYTNIKTILKGGRKFNYDADIMYFNGDDCVSTQKIEFKNGGTSIGNLPQFLSLPVKFAAFSVSYDEFYYDNYLDSYMACDDGITQPKPSLHEYKKLVISVKSSHPLFVQMKERECVQTKEKQTIVNTSITDYLTQYGNQINIAMFSDKINESQNGKIFVMWSNGKFYIDKFTQSEMSDMTFQSVKNGNVIQLSTHSIVYNLLLRWRNHKGILNPAWQISLTRPHTKTTKMKKPKQQVKHICDVCLKRFAMKTGLRRHMETHIVLIPIVLEN